MTKEDVLRIEHDLLSIIDCIADMDDTESFKTFGYMSGVNEMANKILKFLDRPMYENEEGEVNECS